MRAYLWRRRTRPKRDPDDRVDYQTWSLGNFQELDTPGCGLNRWLITSGLLAVRVTPSDQLSYFQAFHGPVPVVHRNGDRELEWTLETDLFGTFFGRPYAVPHEGTIDKPYILGDTTGETAD